VCWSFDVCEGDLNDLYWRYSFRELRQRLQLKYGELAARQLCDYNTLVQVLNQALGGKPAAAASSPSEFSSVEQAVANMNSVLSGA
jgi:hypothetical protein